MVTIPEECIQYMQKYRVQLLKGILTNVLPSAIRKQQQKK